ncbi:histidine kinase [Rhizobium sp. RU36D]|uniref:histidine kinase n=1 Tax=Rhizobium sp. RU36D TaxID=1907415 RepID=UPI0009D7F225|nr:histidine kinase [Rhizobium sp. RU36D]SMD14600.1 hypothetical protein SAMN05880593_12652 [Rhizobium sp. RU36D]
MKRLLIAAAAAILSFTAAQAGEMKFPSDAPVASITLPESWIGKETDTGIEVSSEDDAIYFFIDVADVKSTDAVITDAIKFLSDNGVTIDPASLKESKDQKLNGMDIAFLEWNGTDKDGPASIGMAIAAASAENLLVLTYWGTKGDEEKHAVELGTMIDSLKPVK